MEYRILIFAILIAVCGLLDGCCIFATQSPPGCTVEPKDNSLLGFYAVHLRQTDSGWRLSGRCFQGGHYQYANIVVVAVDVLDANGGVLERHCVSTFPGRLHNKFKDSSVGWSAPLKLGQEL